VSARNIEVTPQPLGPRRRQSEVIRDGSLEKLPLLDPQAT